MPKPERAGERLNDSQLVQVFQKELRRRGWDYYPPLNGHNFIILIHKNLSLDTALRNGTGLFVRHEEVEQKDHIDSLGEMKLKTGSVFATEYNPLINHPPHIVLEEIY